MPEIPAAGVLLRVPVMGELNHWRLVLTGTGFVFRGRQEHQGETALLTLFAGNLHHAQKVAEKVKGVVQIADPNHRVQVLHIGLLWFRDSQTRPVYVILRP